MLCLAGMILIISPSSSALHQQRLPRWRLRLFLVIALDSLFLGSCGMVPDRISMESS